MKKIKKIFLGIGALWGIMMAKVYATINERIMEPLYGIPEPEPKYNENNIIMLAIIAVIVGLNVILRKKLKEKKEVLNIILIISSIVVTVLAIIFIASLLN